jgi:type III secretory pathway lipoprotein EscJ
VSLEFHLELWEAMQEHITSVKDAADDFVAVLIDHGIDANKIAKVAINEDIKKALLDYDVDVDVDVDDDEDEYEWDE